MYLSKKVAVITASVAIMAGLGSQAVADSVIPDQSPTLTCVPGKAKSIAKDSYSHANWEDSDPFTDQDRAEFEANLPCAKSAGKYLNAHKKEFSTYRHYRQIAPFRGFNEGDPYLQWLPIPKYIVSCETNGYSGRGRWNAHNGSGAQGPAQLLGWPAPQNASTPGQKLAYWKEVVHVRQVQGLSAWACA